MKTLLITPEGLEKLKAELDISGVLNAPRLHKKFRGLQVWAIVLKMPTIIIIKNACAKSINVYSICANVLTT